MAQISPNAGVLTSGTVGGNMTVNTTGNITGNNFTGNSVTVNNSGVLGITMNTGTNSATFRGIKQQRSRGTTSAPTTVLAGDIIAQFNSGAYTPFNTYQTGGGVSLRYAADPSTNTAFVPSNISMYSTSTANTTYSLRLDYTGMLTIPGIVQLTPYTVAQITAITGSSGQFVSISDSTPNGGQLAYWDTTNARWSYVWNNGAV